MITLKLGEQKSYPIEEQIILRVPPKLQEIAKKISNSEEVEDFTIKFTGSRNAIVQVAGVDYNAVLVDLPCLIESQKTMDKKQFYKICDISQMLVVLDENQEKMGILDDFQYAHGLTKPMQRVRQRRFRKRATKTNVLQEIESTVTKLIEHDKRAHSVEYFVKYNEGDNEDEESDDSALAAEIEMGFEDDFEVENDDESLQEPLAEESGQNQEMNEESSKIMEEIEQLELRIRDKEVQMQFASNVIVKKRFEDAIVQMKQQIQELQQQLNGQ